MCMSSVLPCEFNQTSNSWAWRRNTLTISGCMSRSTSLAGTCNLLSLVAPPTSCECRSLNASSKLRSCFGFSPMSWSKTSRRIALASLSNCLTWLHTDEPDLLRPQQVLQHAIACTINQKTSEALRCWLIVDSWPMDLEPVLSSPSLPSSPTSNWSDRFRAPDWRLKPRPLRRVLHHLAEQQFSSPLC